MFVPVGLTFGAYEEVVGYFYLEVAFKGAAFPWCYSFGRRVFPVLLGWCVRATLACNAYEFYAIPLVSAEDPSCHATTLYFGFTDLVGAETALYWFACREECVSAFSTVSFLF